MMAAYTTKEYKGYKISWYYDADAESPREWDAIDHIICWHPRYNLGDKHDYKVPRDFLEHLVSEFQDIDEDMPMKELYEVAEKHVCISPVSCYEHGGITAWLGDPTDPWDSGYVGYMYMTKDVALDELNATEDNWRDKAMARMQSSMEEYDTYLRGEVFCYQVEGPDGELHSSCSGFYGTEAVDEETESIKRAIDSELGE